MSPTETLVMTGFGLLAVAGIALSIVQSRRTRRRAADYAARHGWPIAFRDDDPRLKALLDEIAPDVSWYCGSRITIEPLPDAHWLFGYTEHSRRGRGSPSDGWAALAVIDGGDDAGAIAISPRIPGLDRLVGHRLEVGSSEFHDTFTITGPDADRARQLLNADVQGLLLRHRADCEWTFDVHLSRRVAMVSSFWAVQPADWDRLMELTRALREAIRRSG